MYYIPKHQIEILLPLFYNDSMPVKPENKRCDFPVSRITFHVLRITHQGYFPPQTHVEPKSVPSKFLVCLE